MSVTVIENEDLPRRECTYVIKWDSRSTVEILYDLKTAWITKVQIFLATMKRLSNVVRRSSMFVVAARKSSALPDSVISFNGRGSISELPARKINYENTYRMGPDKKPSISELEPIIRDTIATTCDQVDYDEIYPGESLKFQQIVIFGESIFRMIEISEDRNFRTNRNNKNNFSRTCINT